MTNTAVIEYTDAVSRLAASIADRAEFVILTPPGIVDVLAERLTRIPPGWTAYLANRTPMVVTTNVPEMMLLSAALSPRDGIVAVVTVPKTTPAATLSEALGQEVRTDGSQDLIMLSADEAEPIVWPMLFADALEKVDPQAAANIHVTTSGYR